MQSSRHCEERSDEAVQLSFLPLSWIASRSLSSGAHSRDPVARNDGVGGGEPHFHLSRGSSASRNPSPTRLNDSTTRKIARPGHNAIHGALVRKRCAALSMLPH